MSEIDFKEIAALAALAALGSNDPHTKVGAILYTQDPASPLPRFSAKGHNMIVGSSDPASFERPLKYARVIHAEMMAIADAARMGHSTFGGLLYVTHPPCQECAKLIRATGIRTVVVGPGQYTSNTEDNQRNAEYMLQGIQVIKYEL